MQKHQLLIQTVAPVSSAELLAKVRIMDLLARKIAKKYHGTYDGNGVGFGGVDEYLYFGSERSMTAAANGIGPMLQTSEKFKSLRISFWKKNLDEPIRKAKAGVIIKHRAKMEKQGRNR